MLDCAWTDDTVFISHSGKITLTKSILNFTVSPDPLTLEEAKNQVKRLDDILAAIKEGDMGAVRAGEAILAE
jgi:hypothetical protein